MPLGTGVKDLEKLSLKPIISFPSDFSTSLSLSGAEWCPLLHAPRFLALLRIKLGDNENLHLHDFLLYLYFLKAHNEFNLTKRAQEHNPLVSQSVHDHGPVLQSLVETLEVRRHVDWCEDFTSSAALYFSVYFFAYPIYFPFTVIILHRSLTHPPRCSPPSPPPSRKLSFTLYCYLLPVLYICYSPKSTRCTSRVPIKGVN